MGMDLEVQFQDIFSCSDYSCMQGKSSVDMDLDLILGISPLPTQFQEDVAEEKIGDVNIVRKNSIRTVSLDTNLSQEQQGSRMAEDSETEASNVKPSSHHNFQKHTVTALRDLVKESEFENLCQSSYALKLSTRLWREFSKIKGKSIMTKRFLSILFKDDLKSVGMLKAYGFKQMFEDFEERQILMAKNQLRRLVILSLNNKNIQDHVEKRQIKRKEEFRLYLINFRRDLQNANIKKRISKQSSDWIADNAKIFDCLN